MTGAYLTAQTQLPPFPPRTLRNLKSLDWLMGCKACIVCIAKDNGTVCENLFKINNVVNN